MHDTLESNVFASFRGLKEIWDWLRPPNEDYSPSLVNHRYTAMPLECRGVVAQYDYSDSITSFIDADGSFRPARLPPQTNLPRRVRCVAPDVGGGFGEGTRLP